MTRSPHMRRIGIILSILGLLAFAPLSAQIKRLSKFADKTEGFELQVPADWDQIPTQPDEVDILVKWARDTMARGTGELWELQVLRFEPKAMTTPGGKEEMPVGAPEGLGDMSKKDLRKLMRERMRPHSFKEWFKSNIWGAGDLPKAQKGKFKMNKGKARLYAVPELGSFKGLAAIVGVHNDGTSEWAVMYLVPLKQVMKKKSGRWRLKNSSLLSKLLKSLQSFRVTEKERVNTDVRPEDMTEMDRKIWEVKKRLPKGWKVIPTPSKRYVIVHHISQKKTSLITFVKKIVAYLDHARDKYEVLFPPRKPITAVSVVRVCEDREEYHQYGGPGGSAGYWNSADEELVIYNASKEGGKKDSYSTLFHEAFHQYIYYAVGEISPHSWYNEGFGDYFAGMNPKKGFKIETFKWRTGVVRNAVAGKKNVPLKDLIHYTQGQYYSNPSVCYAQGWALIYFLNSKVAKKNPRWAKILDIYFDTLVETGDKDGAVTKAFDGVDVDALDEAYQQFITRGFK